MSNQILKNTELAPAEWILFGPNGAHALYRRAVDFIPAEASLATGLQLLAANRGNAFPWGNVAQPHPHNRQWNKYRLGVGGLIHDRWFVTKDGRFGGAPNVPQVTPGSLRCCMYLDGGGLPDDLLAENEGYAIVREASLEDQKLYRKVQLYAATHVMADGGAIIHSPLLANNKVYVGFVGRCQICPNAELISFPQLQTAIPDYDFHLWPEWKNWQIDTTATAENLIALDSQRDAIESPAKVRHGDCHPFP